MNEIGRSLGSPVNLNIRFRRFKFPTPWRTFKIKKCVWLARNRTEILREIRRKYLCQYNGENVKAVRNTITFVSFRFFFFFVCV